MKIKFLCAFVFMGLGILSFASGTKAATLFLAPPSSEIALEKELTINLKIDSEGISLNAVQAVLRFPKDTLEVVSLDKTNSAFSFWLEEPNFSNSDGVISLIAGTPYGVSGGSIHVLKIVFKAKGSGSGIITLDEVAITASDGSGTNILSKTVEAAFVILAKKEITPVPVPVPIPIVREPVPTGELPIEPELEIPLYSDVVEWSNLTSQFNVNWDLPLDVTGVSTAVDKQPGFLPQKSEGLFDNKNFPALSDGTWYLHVSFENNVGWGSTTHHTLAIDTQPPLGFEITILEGETTDNPTPTLQFETSDALSGLKEYQIRVGDEDLVKIPAADFNGSYKLSLQSPGKRQIAVKAVDQANNSIENSLMLEIIPIASPTITFITKELFSDEERGLTVKGISLPNINILLRVYRGEALAVAGVAHANEEGNWEITFDQSLKNGQYFLTAQSQDERGALSLAVKSSEVLVKSKPIIQIGRFQLGMGGALTSLLIVIILGFSAGVWSYKKRQEKLALRLLIVKTDLAKVFKLIQDDIEKLHQAIKTPTEADDEFIIKKLRENIKKMEGYLNKEIEKIKK